MALRARHSSVNRVCRFLFMITFVLIACSTMTTTTVQTSKAAAHDLPFSVPKRSFLGSSKANNLTKISPVPRPNASQESSQGDSGVTARATCNIDSDISVSQRQEGSYNGEPNFLVSVINVCSLGCSFRNIHVRCGSFSSAIFVNPSLFRRLQENDCLLLNGNALYARDSVIFNYASNFQYPMEVFTGIPNCD